MAAGDQYNRVPPYQRHQLSPRLWLYRPIAGIRLVGAVEKQRPMQKPGDLTAGGLFHYRVEPGCLHRLLAAGAAEQHRIEPDEANSLDILDPPVRPENGAPSRQPFVGKRLSGMSGIADIVVAGNRAKADSEA